MPTNAYGRAACWDLYAVEDVEIEPGSGRHVSCGFAMEIPPHWAAFIHTRSKYGFKGMRNHLGVIDEDYRGEIGVYIFNHLRSYTNTTIDPMGEIKWAETLQVRKGDKIGQMFFAPVPLVKWSEVEELSDTDRGEGGWGSSDNARDRNH